MIELLSDDEFDALSSSDQEAYLDLLAAEWDAQERAWVLNPRQEQAEELCAEVDEFLYGGAAGGGKSEWLLWHADHLSRTIPGHASLILRNSFPELRRSLIRRSMERLLYDSPECDRPVWRAADKEWRYPNDSVIELGYCASDDDVGQYLSAEYDFIGFDEQTEFSEYQYDMIRSRARTTARQRARGSRPHIAGATNPGRTGHAWNKERFVKATDYGERIATETITMPTGQTVTRTRAFLPATVVDNPKIDSGYVENLMTLPENLRKQYLEGDWDSFEGQYFPEWTRARTMDDGSNLPWHVIEPFEVPHEWPRFRAVDWGSYNPFACLWFAVDQDGYVYVYREAYQTKLTPQQQAELIDRMSVATVNGITRKEKIDYTVGDPAMWSQQGSLSIAAQYGKAGLHMRKADNDRLAGWARVRDWLREDEHGNPGVRVFSSCNNFIRTFPELVHDKNRPEDLDTTGEDHLADAFRYGLMTRPRRYQPKVAEKNTIEARVKRMVDRLAGRARNVHPELGRI